MFVAPKMSIKINRERSFVTKKTYSPKLNVYIVSHFIRKIILPILEWKWLIRIDSDLNTKYDMLM